MELSRLFAVALSGLLFIQAPVVAFAEEEYSQDGELYQCDNKGNDYLFVGKNGFFLSNKEHQNKDNPYPSNNTAFIINLLMFFNLHYQQNSSIILIKFTL